MRKSTNTLKNRSTYFGKLQSIAISVMIVMLFVFIFSSVIISVGNFNFASAESSRDATATTISSIKNGLNVADEFNGTATTALANKFGISGDSSDVTNQFGWNNAGRGWGFSDWSFNHGGVVYWLDYELTNDALTAVRDGRVSFYAESTATYGGTWETNDYFAFAISFIGTTNGTVNPSTTDMVNAIAGTSNNRNDSWNSSTRDNYISVYSGWTRGSGTNTLGTTTNAFSEDYIVPTGTTKIRLVFAAIGSGDLHGGFTNIQLKLFEKEETSIASNNTTYDLTQTLYGIDYSLQNDNPSCYTKLNVYRNEDSGSYETKTALTDKDLSNSESDSPFNNDCYKHKWSGKPESGSGVLMAYGGRNVEIWFAMLTYITVPKAVTSIKIDANIYLNACADTIPVASGYEVYMDSHLEIWEGKYDDSDDGNNIANNSTMLIGSPLQTSESTRIDILPANGTNEVGLVKKPVALEINDIKTDAEYHTFTVVLRAHAKKQSYANPWVGVGDDFGQMYAILGDIQVSHKGYYGVEYNAHGGVGDMSGDSYQYGLADANELLSANAFTNGDSTFVGWATTENGAVAYQDRHDTSIRELTNIPGEVVKLYAVWRESDFGRLDNGSGDWGSSGNPFVIADRDDWINLADIVNKSRDPVNSVTGTYYDKNITTNTAANDVSFANCYFVVTAESLDLGDVAPVGYNAQNLFRGNIYGGTGEFYSNGNAIKTKRDITANVNIVGSEAYQAGLFGCIDGATIEYLSVSGTVVNSESVDDTYAGGIVAYISGTSTISDCTSSVNVINATFDVNNLSPTGKRGAGGIVGYIADGANATIQNCTYTGGDLYKSTSSSGELYFEANIYGEKNIGAIVGESNASRLVISGCSATKGKLLSTESAGGIIGAMKTGASATALVSHVYNATNVTTGVLDTGASAVGGILGYGESGSDAAGSFRIEYAYNGGSVTGKGKFVGGIAGQLHNKQTAQIEYCYNTGAVAGTTDVNTIKGTGVGTVSNSWGLYVQGGDSADFNAILGTTSDGEGKGISGNKAILALGAEGTYKTEDYFRPSDSSNKTTYSWTDITNTNLNFTKFAVLADSKTLADNKYLAVYGANNSATITPDYTDNSQTGASIQKPSVTVQNIVINSAQDSAITQIAVEFKNIVADSDSAREITYGDDNPQLSSWIEQNVAQDKNAYVTKFEIFYFVNGSWVDYVKDVLYDNGEKPYSVKVAFYNGDYVVGVKLFSEKYTIKQKTLQIDAIWWVDEPDKNGQYLFNGGNQGIRFIEFNGFADDENIESVFNITNTCSGDVGNTKIEITTKNAGEYGISFAQIKSNYKLVINKLEQQNPAEKFEWKWEITQVTIANPDKFDQNTYNIFFGYGAGGIASGSYSYYLIDNTDLVYALDMRVFGEFYGEKDSPYALMFADNKVSNNINNYNLYIKNEGAYIKLVRGQDYDIAVTGATLNDDGSLTFTDGVAVTMTLSGKNNYSGTRKIRFTPVSGDFGGNADSAGYGGSKDNPYIIANEAHLIRLGQIVLGSPAWNSINSDNTDIALARNENAAATDRTYKGGYFLVTADISTSTAAGFNSIGKLGKAFSATFDGDGHTLTLVVNETDTDYTGLFGYVTDASIKDITVSGSISGRDYVGGIVGKTDGNTVLTGIIQNNAAVTGRYYVGGIAGELTVNVTDVVNGATASVSGMGAVGGIAGALGKENLVVAGAVNRGKVNYKAYDGQISTDGLQISVNDRNNTISVNGIGGIVGLITKSASIEGAANYEISSSLTVDGSGANCVGGIVGYASVADGTLTIKSKTTSRGDIKGASFVGGIVGYAYNVTIEEDCDVQANVTGGGMYTGGIVGKWIVNNVSQMPGQRKVHGNVTISGDMYVGGLVGWLDASAAKGLKLNPHISNGENDNNIEVKGRSYVGALYGGVVGGGYKRNSVNISNDDTLIYIHSETGAAQSIKVKLTLFGGGHVAGGLIGYVERAGILFLGDWVGLEHTPIVFEGETSFFGGVIGVLGENASIESATNYDGNTSVGGVTYTIRFRTSQSGSTVNVGGDFVGSIVGYIASTAGAYLTADTTLMGNNIKLYNSSDVKARSFVGGIFGAIGKVKAEHYLSTNGINEFIFEDTYLLNLIRYGNYGATATGANTTLRYAPSDDGGLGKLFNLSPISGSGDFVGGIVGYAGDNALLDFANPIVKQGDSFTMSDADTYLNIYNGYKLNPTGGDTETISGFNYVGGIAGYVSGSAHKFTRVVSLMLIRGSSNQLDSDGNIIEDGSFVGGLLGYMGGGAVISSMATSGYSNPSEDINAFRGKEYVGGLVGMLYGGSISSSVSRGFRFESVDITRGGVAGGVNAGTSIDASWTFYLAKNPTFATTSKNRNGKYVIVNTTLIKGGSNLSPSFSEYAKTIGLFDNSIAVNTQASDNTYNPVKNGFMSMSTPIPNVGEQLVFYNASGNDVATENEFETLSSHAEGDKDMVYYRFDITAMDSFSICVLEISFRNIKSNPTDDDEGKKFVRDAYVRPSANDFYDVAVNYAHYDVNGNIDEAYGDAICIGANNPYNDNNIVILGRFDRDFEIGKDPYTPHVISGQTEWDDFARNIRNGKSYANEFVKLATDIVTVTASVSSLTGSIVSNLAGDASSNTNVFMGTFDGDGHTITINVESDNRKLLSGMSVFPNAAGAKFKNLTIAGDIKAIDAAFDLAENSNKDEDNAANIAGFVGKPTGELWFENCTNLVNIKAHRTAGGIVGFTNGKAIHLVSCVNKGDIECNDVELASYINYDYGTGGIIGYATNEITIESCKNEGNITGGYNVGGIIGQNNAKTNIYNCANTGKIFGDGFWISEEEYAAKSGYGYIDTPTYRLIYAGGILGQVGPQGSLTMLACYNSGEVTGFGIIEGGLVGSVGRLSMENTSSDDIGVAGGKSLIAYCYNTGDVYSGGRNRQKEWHYSDYNSVGREELAGTLCGGIVGFIADGDINYCYNTGTITAFRIVGMRVNSTNQWQLRMGGIIGQAQPSGVYKSTDKDGNETSEHYQVNINYCYNIGQLYANTYTYRNTWPLTNYMPCYGGGILGYVDRNNSDNNYVASYECYTVANYLHYKDEAETNHAWGSSSLYGSSDNWYFPSCYIPGTSTIRIGDEDVPLTVEHFTTYMTEDGTFKVDRPIGGSSNVQDNPSASSLIDANGNSLASFDGTNMTYNDAFKNGTAYGYIYTYGCLPQLAVFALDTKEGLSMMSVSYGRNDYGEFVGNQAGSKESPYVIKDGVGLLAMSALTGTSSNIGSEQSTAYYSFKGKYIEFANGTNNIENAVSRYINMDMTYDASANADTIISLKSASEFIGTSSVPNYENYGKNYFLWRDGAVSGVTSHIFGADSMTDTGASQLRSDMRGAWLSKNKYFNGTESAADASYVDFAGFYPIGGIGTPFEGSISGKQGAFNTEVRDLRVTGRAVTYNSLAGLFGTINDATVSNITVDGIIKAYAYDDSADYRSFAGGIVGYAGGNSSIIGCQAGVSGRSLAVTAYSKSNDITEPLSIGYAGGIAGAAGPSRKLYSQELNTLEIVDSRAANATVKSLKTNAGGIVGYVGYPWNTNLGNVNYVNILDAYVYNSYITTLENVISSGNVEDKAGTDIGGIVGTNDGQTRFTVNGAHVGIAHPDDSDASNLKVEIEGENSFGGVIGTARGNSAFSNVEIGEAVAISRVTRGDAENVGDGLYRTAIGGVIGRTLTNSTNTLRDSIVYNGHIFIGVINTVSNDENPTGNIGGVIGAMGAGTQFLSGSNVSVKGSIEIDSELNDNYIRNIGGVVGATIEGAFDGTFEVNPQITAENATNVGGFIGRNFGETHILASNAGTNIFINATIIANSQVGGLVGLNGYTYVNGEVAGTLIIGADTYLGVRYEGKINIEIGEEANITASGTLGDSADGNGNDAGGIVGSNTANGNGLGLIITKGRITNKGTVSGLNNVGGLVGNNAGDITMGGSTLVGEAPVLINEGNVNGGKIVDGKCVEDGNNVGGAIGYLQRGTIAGTFANTGTVVGGMFVGGSIGRLDEAAIITVSGSNNTYFYNGANSLRDSGDTFALDTTVGNVTGKMYVGGSIGAMFGAVRGTSSNYVSFVNGGIVEGDTFVGGNIGLLAGGVDNAQFTNRGRVVANGAVAIGGSVGFIGISNAYDNNDYVHQNISVQNTNFEFIAALEGGAVGIEVLGTQPDGVTDEFKWGGVGGAIGVIGSEEDGFDNVNGKLWQNVTLYAEGSIKADTVNNVGGAIGLIKANNIVIKNMLAFYTNIAGANNVGGIVGAITGLKAEINNSFNIEGTVSGSNAGGIVGRAVVDGEGVTVADTSYWVKGYANAQLMALDLQHVVDDLGKYVAVVDGNTVFTQEFTDAYGTPAHYTGNDEDGEDWAAYLAELCKKQLPNADPNLTVKVINGVWAYEQNTDGYTTGTANTGWYYVFANDRRGLDTTHISAKNNLLPSQLKPENGDVLAEELAYWKRIADAYTADERRPNDDGIIEATKELKSAIVGQVNGTTVSGNGDVTQGYIYAAALESKVNGYYLYMDASGEKPSIYYNKNAINWNDTGALENPFYLIAKTSLDKSDNNDKNAQNVAIYYRSVGVGGTLTYNGYKRYVPITDEIGKADESSEMKTIKYLPNGMMLDGQGNSGDYVYKMQNVRKDGVAMADDNIAIVTAGEYLVNVEIYYYDTLRNHGKIGGITDGTLRIEQLKLNSEITYNKVDGKYDGENTRDSITLKLDGIAPLDDGVNKYKDKSRDVQFNISGTRNLFKGVLHIGELIKGRKTSSGTFTADQINATKQFASLDTDKIYLASYNVTETTNTVMSSLDWDTECIFDGSYTKDVKTYSIEVTFKFTSTISDKFKVELANDEISASYLTDVLEVDFDITPKKLTLELSGGASTGHDYDGSAQHTTQYQFTGWAASDLVTQNKPASIINSLSPYVQYKSLDGKIVYGGSGSLWDMISKGSYTLSANGVTYFTVTWDPINYAFRLDGMKERGNYFVRFATTKTYTDENGKLCFLSDDGNYYVEVPMDSKTPTEQAPLYMVAANTLEVKWTNGSSVYDAKTKDLVATFTVKKTAFASGELLKAEIESLFPADYKDYKYEIVGIDGSTATVTFKVGPNAKTYTVELPGDTTTNCIVNSPNNGTYTISQLKLEIKFDVNKSHVYDGKNHEASSIAIKCLNGSDDTPTEYNLESNGEYTITVFGGGYQIDNRADDNKVIVTLQYVDEKGVATATAVNAGTYTAKIGTWSYASKQAQNFEVTANAQEGSFEITPVKITLGWVNASSTFTYDNKAHGNSLKVVSSNASPAGTLTSLPDSNEATFKWTNASKKEETLTFTLTGNGKINASKTDYNVSVNTTYALSGTNSAGSTVTGNYELTFPSGSKYRINALDISVDSIIGGTLSKEYDATVNFVGTLGTPKFDNALHPTSYKVEAVYNSANVKEANSITYTITITGATDASNFNLVGNTCTVNASITERLLTITLDMLKKSRATKLYNGDNYFGGSAGATSSAGKTTAVSAIHRSGEGFIVSNIAEAETVSGAVRIIAQYIEAIAERSRFNAFVNNVVVNDDGSLSIGTSKYGASENEYFYKNLVFTFDSTSIMASNYKIIKVEAGANGASVATVSTDGKTATVNGKNTNGIVVEITPLTVSATYHNTKQSYATLDNAYNTNWIDVDGEINGIVGIRIDFVNNWKYKNGNPAEGVREYNTYTLIRGGENSKLLAAKLVSDDGIHVNYRLGNQPILTIGYFVDRDGVFEVGSIAGLMIASYYYSASKNDGEFGIIGQATWTFIVSDSDYMSNSKLPTEDEHGNPIEVESWDEYFELLAQEGKEVVLNTTETQSGWGYYSSTVTNVTFEKFKQVANISGVLSAMDIAILDGMFKKTVIDADGNVNEDASYDWGKGNKYLQNFLKLRAGSVATAMGSVFDGVFGGEYDGNGYVIDSLNIIGIADKAENYYVGMFSQIASGASVKNVHLRNVSITANATNGRVYIGAIAGESLQPSVENVSAHAIITANMFGQEAFIGGLFGAAASTIDGATTLGSITLNATAASSVGGTVGKAMGDSVKNVVSLMQIWTKTTAKVGGILGTDSTAAIDGTAAYMKDSVWSGGEKVISTNYEKSYSELYNNGSISGYTAGSEYYYFGDEGNRGGKYDVLDDIKLTKMDGEDGSRTNPRESMRLKDIIDVYLLMYAKSETTADCDGVKVAVYTMSKTSWLVGTAHGTGDDDAIVIANQQGIALMRELRFATFKVTQNVYMNSTYKLQTATGAFFGKVISENGSKIVIASWNGTQQMFEKEPDANNPTSVLQGA